MIENYFSSSNILCSEGGRKHRTAYHYLVRQGVAAAAQPQRLLPQPGVGDGLKDGGLGIASLHPMNASAIAAASLQVVTNHLICNQAASCAKLKHSISLDMPKKVSGSAAAEDISAAEAAPAGRRVAAQHVGQRGEGARLADGLARLCVLRAQPHQRRSSVGVRRARQVPAQGKAAVADPCCPSQALGVSRGFARCTRR